MCCDALSMIQELPVLFCLGKDEMESLRRAQAAGSAILALKEGTAPLLRRGSLWLQIIQIISWIF